MKATVLVRLKEEVLDPQGDAVRRALGTLGWSGVRGVRVGKIIEIDLDDKAVAGTGDRDALLGRLRTMADEMLANTVIEDYDISLD
jgi:phosphoribosylformylglycinamidine synthase subunit PurS